MSTVSLQCSWPDDGILTYQQVPHAVQNWNIAVMGPGGSPRYLSHALLLTRRADLTCPFIRLFTNGERPSCTHSSSIEFEECQGKLPSVATCMVTNPWIASRGIGFQKKQFTVEGCPAVVHICQGHTESHEFLIEFP